MAYANLLAQLETQNGLPSGTLQSVMYHESGSTPDSINTSAVSPVGARGPFQIMPSNAQAAGIDPEDPEASARWAAKELGNHYKNNGRDLDKALAAWNWGGGNLKTYGMAKAPKETRDFIQKVRGHMSLDPNTGLPAGAIIQDESTGTTQPSNVDPSTGLPSHARIDPLGGSDEDFDKFLVESGGPYVSKKNELLMTLRNIHKGNASNEEFATAFGYDPETIKGAFNEGDLAKIYKAHKDYINSPKVLPLISGIGEGLNSLATGTLQASSRLMKAITPKFLNAGQIGVNPEAADLYAKVTQLGRDRAANTGKFGEWLRRFGDILGQTAPFLAQPELKAAQTIGGAVGKGALTGLLGGATAGALQPVDVNPSDPSSFLKQKALQMGVGGVGGATLGSVTGGLAGGIDAYVNAKNARYAAKFAGLEPGIVQAGPEGGAPALSKALSVENPAFDFEATLSRAASDPAHPYKGMADKLMSDMNTPAQPSANPFANNTSAKLQQSMRGQLLKNKIDLHDAYQKLGQEFEQHIPNGIDVREAIDALKKLHQDLTGIPVEEAARAAAGNPNVSSREANLVRKWIEDLSPKGSPKMETKLVWDPHSHSMVAREVPADISFNKPVSEVQEILSHMKGEGFKSRIAKSVTYGKQFGTIKDAQDELSEALQRELSTAGRSDLWEIQRAIDGRWRSDVHGYDAFADLLDPKKTAPEAFTKALMEGNADNQRKAVSTLMNAYNRLDTTGKKLWPQAIVERSMDKAVDNGSLVNFGKLDPALHNLENARMVLPPEQQKMIQGYVNLLKSDIERAATPGAGVMDIAKAKLAPLDIVKKLSNPFFRTPLGRNILIGASDTPPGTPGFITNVLLKNQMPRWGAAALAGKFGLKSKLPDPDSVEDVEHSQPDISLLKEEPPMGAQIRHEGKIKTWNGKEWR